jgi:hypothetical protein
LAGREAEAWPAWDHQACPCVDRPRIGKAKKMAAADDLEDDFVKNLELFWAHKAQRDGKKFKFLDVGNPADAVRLVRTSARAAKRAR